MPEDDEKKAHKHLFMVPSKLMDTGTLIDYLKEVDPTDPLGRPLGIIMPTSSKFADWFQYACHDVGYLASKGQVRRFGYTVDDFKTSNDDYFAEMRHTIDYGRSKTTARLVESAKQGVPFSDLVVAGVVPINLIAQCQTAYALICSSVTERAGKTTHQKVDPETGEVLDGSA